MADIIPFEQLATLDNPVFQAAGVAPKPETSAAPIPFDQIESAPSQVIDASEISNVDDFHRRTTNDLHNDEKFDPRQYFAENPDIAKDPAQLQKLIDVYRARRERGVTLGAVSEGVKAAPATAVKFAKGLGTLASNVFEFSGLQPLFNKAASVVTGDAFDKQKSEALEQESENRARKAYSEFQAATELSATGLSDLGRTGVRKVFGKPIKDTSDQELLAQLSEDASFQNQLREIQSGRGETLKNAGLDADTLAKDGIQLDSNAIENLSLVDPATVIATAGLFKVVGTGGKILATAATEAGAAKAAAALNNLTRQTAGKAVQAAGRAVTATGEGTAKVVGAIPETVTEAVGAGTGLAKTGSVSGAYVGAKAARGIQTGIVKAGQGAAKLGEGITNLGEQISGQIPVSAGVQKLADFVGTYGRPVTGAVKGAAIGTAAAAPLALLADENQTAGGILSGGIALGGVAGGAHGTFGAVTEAAANRYFGAHEKLLPAVESPAYGIDPALDTAHQSAIESLPIRERNLINNFREGTRNVGGEFYALNEAEYARQVAEAYKRETGNDISPDLLQKYADTHAQFSEYRPDAAGNVRKVVLLNADATGLLHDAGHLFDASLTPEVAESLRQAVRDTFTPEQLADAQARYERRLGEKITPERAMDEFIAEQFNALFHNVPLTEMTAPQSLISRFTDTIAKGAEALGVDLTAGKVTPSLGNPLSVGLRELFKNAASEIAKQNENGAPPANPAGPAAPAGTPPAAPVAPTPTAPAAGAPSAATPPAAPPTAARNIRVTQAQQDAFAKRAAETGVTEAKANVKEPETAARVKEISDSMEAGNPVLEIEHLGITNEGSPAAPTGRTARRGEQAKGYAELEAIRADNRANAPESIVNLHQKTFVPVRWTNQGGTPTLIAMSLDKVIRNMHSIVADAASKGVADRIPYENANGKLTEAGWNKAIADAQAYAENQSNGFRGDGRQLTRPTEDLGFSIPAENPDYKPQLLGEAEANFQNLIQGLATPETAREQKGLTPGNIKGQVLAETNKRATFTPAEIKSRNVGKQAFKSFPGRTVREVNPLRNDLAKAGVDVRDLIEVTERIRAKDVASVKPRPDINFKAPVTDIIRGGFLPAEGLDNLGRQVADFTTEEWRAWTTEHGGLTNEAFRIGASLTDPADLVTLRKYEAEMIARAAEAKKSGDLDALFPVLTKKQFFTEAIQAAEGTANERVIKSILGPDYTPPFPKDAGEVKFLPRTKAAKDLAEQGFDFRISGQPSVRAVTVLKDGVEVGEIQSAQRTPDVAEISMVSLKPQVRGSGAAEAAYRELLTQLKEDGAKKIEGTVVAPQPLAIRRKIFGGFDRLELNGEPVNINDAIHAANEIKTSRAREILNIEAVNEIRPDMQFLPKISPVERLTKYGELTEKFKLIDEALGPVNPLTPRLYEVYETPKAMGRITSDRSVDASRRQYAVEIMDQDTGERLAEGGLTLDEAKKKIQIGLNQIEGDYPRRAGGEEASAFLPGEETDQARRSGLLPDKAPPRTPSQPIRDIAAAYAETAGLDYAPDPTYAPVDPKLGRKLADFYDAAKSDPADPKVKASYDALKAETEAQARQILDAGYTIEPYQGEGEPYKSSAEMVKDVRENKHLYYLQTDKTFGGEGGVAAAGDNPMLAESTVTPGPRVNDVFRWVHDFFGHAKEGYQFGPRGEFNAWRAHSEMYSPEAQGALAAETLAQNSWVNYGKHLEGKDVPLAERPFGEQKNVVVPQNLIDEAHAVGEDIKFLPKKASDEKKSVPEFPGYIVPAPQNRGLRREIEARGVTEQFWINAKTGKVILAPDGHEEAAGATVLKDEPAIRDAGDTAVYDAMYARGWVRGVLEPDDTAQPAIHLNGAAAAGPLGAAARRTMEDIAFKTGRPVLLNDRQLDIGPVQPNEQVPGDAGFFLPKKQKRDDEGRPLTKEGLIDYERLYKEKIAAEKKQEREDAGKSLAAYDIPNNQTELSQKGLTGWLLPNKKFVPLDTEYHQQFLAENAEKLNKQFGTNFSDVSDVEARLAALNAGFTRLRYEANRGALHIETAAKNWSATRKQILDRILAAEGSIDNLIVNLLDPKGNVVDSISEKLFNVEGPEKLNKIEEALDSLRTRGPRFLPKEQSLPGLKAAAQDDKTKLAENAIARAKNEFPEARLPVYARDDAGNVRLNWEGSPLTVPVDYDLSNTPLAKEAAKGLKGPEREKAIAAALGDKLVREYKSAVKNPSIEAGSKWYSTARSRLKKLLGDDAKFFAELLGATSPQTGVETNFKYAVEAYNQFKSGAYDDILAKYREGKKAWADADIDNFLRDTKIEEPTRGQFLDWWVKKYNLIPTQSNGKRFGLHSRAVLRVLDRSWLSEVKGPKTPNFTGNLTGETFEATIDVWAARALHRLANEGNTKRWRILPGNETGVTDPDFYLGQAAYRHAAEKLGIKPDSLQAVLWFAEKQKWEENGWTKAVGAKKSDFNSLLAETEKSDVGTLRPKVRQKSLVLE